MEKITRKKFLGLISEKKLANAVVCSDEKLTQKIEILKKLLEEKKDNSNAYLPVVPKSNGFYRVFEGKKSYLHFKKDDEVYMTSLKDHIIFIYKSFNNILYVLKK